MEVASPLTHVKAGTKRRFACSPMMDHTMDEPDGAASTALNPTAQHASLPNSTSTTSTSTSTSTTNSTSNSMVVSSPFEQNYKRRRFNDENVPNMMMSGGGGGSLSSTTNTHNNNVAWTFQSTPSLATKGLKRQRHDEETFTTTQSFPPSKPSPQLQQLLTHIETLQTQIQTLQTDKSTLQNSLTTLQETNTSLSNQNKILKKGIQIQQERQANVMGELEKANLYKAEAEEKMRRYEGMIGQLRYHLEVMQQGNSNGVHMPQPPPDVF